MTSELSVIKNLTPEQRRVFEAQMQAARKNPSTALILSLFGLSRFYLGQVGLGILQWILVPVIVGLLWMIVDIFTAQSRAQTANQDAALAIASAVRVAVPVPTAPTRKCPFCAEMIQKAATKCKYCGEFLSLESESTGTLPPVISDPVAGATSEVQHARVAHRSRLELPIILVFFALLAFSFINLRKEGEPAANHITKSNESRPEVVKDITECPTGSESSQWTNADGSKGYQCKLPRKDENGLDVCLEWDMHWNPSVSVPCGSRVSHVIVRHPTRLSCPDAQQLYKWDKNTKSFSEKASCLPRSWEIIVLNASKDCPTGYERVLPLLGDFDACAGPTPSLTRQ